jgi:acetate---CoA ligase (ADP-forming)
MGRFWPGLLRSRPIDTLSLHPLLEPRSVAVIGASDEPDKIGGRSVHYLQRFGFAGPVYPVNPNRTEVQGLAAFPDIESLPEAPDVAVIVVPGEAAMDAAAVRASG